MPREYILQGNVHHAFQLEREEVVAAMLAVFTFHIYRAIHHIVPKMREATVSVRYACVALTCVVV
jgi:hypothetical protein